MKQRAWLFLIKNTDIQTQVHPCAFMFAHTHNQQKGKTKKAEESRRRKEYRNLSFLKNS